MRVTAWFAWRNWYQNLRNFRRVCQATQRRHSRHLNSFRQLHVEPLEARHVLTASFVGNAWTQMNSEDLSAALVGKEFVADELIVALKSGAAMSTFQDALNAQASENSNWSTTILSSSLMGQSLVDAGFTLYQVTLDVRADFVQTLSAISQWAEVEWVAPNFIYHADIPDLATSDVTELPAGEDPDFTPNDPSFASQYHHTLMQNQAAWNLSQGAGVIVAVTDDGVDWTHADLAANIWSTSDEIAATWRQFSSLRKPGISSKAP